MVTQGIVSGVRCGLAVNVGDRLALASAGHVRPLNTITPLINLISGLVGGSLTAQATGGA